MTSPTIIWGKPFPFMDYKQGRRLSVDNCELDASEAPEDDNRHNGKGHSWMQ